MTTETIFCQKLQKDGVKLSFAPYPGELGQKIVENISQEAWQMWLNHQVILINEYRLDLMDSEARKFLQAEMVKFLFEGKDEKPEQFVEVGSK
ncbi:oxidative damage protection protein [Thiotrichales bacterium 19S9-12]|nr:oxidative damage protection protein [Thiotrichales bacterium 19S9-11]MCF6812048.1 oxidative damage protection protein [Thiotrichales bacterium 19S9-12]